MRMIGLCSWIAAACVGLTACASRSDTAADHYNFGGVFDDTVAGNVARSRPPRRPDGPPNVVLIIADDLGWPYYGFLGDQNVMTPNLDILGSGGAVFEVGHATANHCRPTLQSLVTGLYPVQYETRVADLVDARVAAGAIPADAEPADRRAQRRELETSMIAEFATLPRLLGEAGYVSHQSGKWWEQSYADGGFTHGMTPRWRWQDTAALGDNWFFTFMGGAGMEIGRETMAPVTDFIAAHADQPFFVWYGPALPHVPFNPPQKFYKYYADRADLSESAKLYYANIAWFDWGVGEVLDALDAQGVLDNTLIVYVNDNGWQQDAGVEYANDPITFGNGGPRGKGSFFETAMRTPIMFYWADQIAARRDRDTLASAIDIMPTILDYAGVAAPEGLPGVSLRPWIDARGGDVAPASPRQALIGKLTRHRAGTDFRGNPDPTTSDMMGSDLSGYYVRDARWHFVVLDGTGETALYDLIADPGQTNDVSADRPDVVARLTDQIAQWRARYEAP